MNLIYRSFIYDFLYLAADTTIKRENPCKIHTNIEGKVVCVRDSPCCSDCEHLSNTGCTIRCLRCKLYLCGLQSEKILDTLHGMLRISSRYKLNWIGQNKAWVMDSLKRQRKVEPQSSS